ncbi:hypothetical protein ACQPZ2_01035 [Nocardia pseudovaccinii]|uniref:hypothetical protein n=1 Tax=Nocardia pseudovaccinii TaxID=189540 RepID=UPI003D8F0218
MSHGPYRLSFTTGGLLRAEAVALAEIAWSASNAKASRRKAFADNGFQQRTSSSTSLNAAPNAS